MVEIICSQIAVASLKMNATKYFGNQMWLHKFYIKKSSKYFLFSFHLLYFLALAHTE